MVLLRQRIGFGIAFGLVGLLLVGAVEAVGGGARGGSVVPVPGQASLGGSGTATPFDLPAAVATSLTDAGLLPQATGIIYPTSVPIPSPVVQISVPDGAALDLVGQAATADGCWTLFRSPTSTWLLGDASLSGLNTITALGRNDVWAGGFRRDSSLSLHWDGATWQAVPSPNIGSRGSSLSALAGRAADDVWGAVQWRVESGGLYEAERMAGASTIVHWDGHAWRIMPDTEMGGINQIVTRAVDDAWAVGSFNLGKGNSGMTLLHWDGKSWQDRSAEWPNAANGITDGLDGAAAPAAHDLWAVGSDLDDQIVHWDGLTMSTVETATAMLPPVGSYSLAAVSASRSGDVWVVGSYQALPGIASHRALILHWDGRGWSHIFAPDSAGTSSQLTTVVAPSADDVWGLGSRGVADLTEPMLLHGTGQTWRVINLPKLLPPLSEFTAMSATGDTVWLAGYTHQSAQNASARNGLVVRLSKGACAGATATPARP